MLDDKKKNWPYYSAALVKLQKIFVKKRPTKVKDLIRLVKHWRKTFVPQSGGERLPPSYLLELLTIHAWENANRPESFDVKIGFKAVMELLKYHHKLSVSWGDYYEKDVITYRYILRLVWISFARIKGTAFYCLGDTGCVQCLLFLEDILINSEEQ